MIGCFIKKWVPFFGNEKGGNTDMSRLNKYGMVKSTPLLKYYEKY